MPDRRACKATNKAGGPCKASPLTDKNFCAAHDPDAPADTRFGSPAQAREAGALGGRPPKPRPHELLQEIIEADVLAFAEPYLKTLGLEVVRDEAGAITGLGRIVGGGAKLHGESKDGDIVVSDAEDLEAMQRAVERLFDRVYGKPRQALEHTGPEGTPVTGLVTDAGLAREARELLRRAADTRED